jgi:hypothetical protein
VQKQRGEYELDIHTGEFGHDMVANLFDKTQRRESMDTTRFTNVNKAVRTRYKDKTAARESEYAGKATWMVFQVALPSGGGW